MLKTKSGRGFSKVLLLALILTTWAFVGIACASGATAPEEEWNRTFGEPEIEEVARSVQQTADGGYVLAGTRTIFGTVGVDYADYLWLIKTDSDGIEIWNKTFGGSGNDGASSVQQTADGGYILSGTTGSYGAGSLDLWLIKTDSDGTELWNKTFGTAGEEWGILAQQTADGGYILLGTIVSSLGDPLDFWLIKMEANGTKQWNTIIGGTSYEKSESVQQTADGGYILAGFTYSYGAGLADAWLVKTDANGTEQWNRTFGGSGFEYDTVVQQTADGGYVLLGSTNSYGAGGYDFWLVKTDSNGIESWNRTFGGSGNDRANSVQQTADGGYILAGGTNSYGAGGYDFWLVKTDSNGNELWNRTFGESGFEYDTVVQQTADGGYVLLGSTNSYGTDGFDIWLIKLAPPINQAPTAVIDSITPNPAKQGRDTISFFGHGTDPDGSVVAYNWASSIDGLLNTSPSFTKPASELSVGVHTIYFSVQDDDDAWSSAVAENLTIITNQLPVASFSYLPVNSGINDTVTFNASASYDPDGSIISYNWSFGDGNVFNATEVIVTHSYSSVGDYIVNLTVTDDEGATNTTSRELQVCLKPPLAKFSHSPPNPAVNETVTFNASESYDPNGFITTYKFEFGDGTNGTGEEVTHNYSSVGMYTVKLTLIDDEGATNRTSQVVKVFPNVSYFDTEPGTYPSICGIHNGTIEMTHTVNVSEIFIYSCVGTGGHIKYAKIWNASWGGTEAHWSGYTGDWHNCSFDKNFTLVAGETYNYTIYTGSYSQVHHKPELLTAKGWITCTEFTDVNGKRYCT